MLPSGPTVNPSGPVEPAGKTVRISTLPRSQASPEPGIPTARAAKRTMVAIRCAGIDASPFTLWLIIARFVNYRPLLCFLYLVMFSNAKRGLTPFDEPVEIGLDLADDQLPPYRRPDRSL